MRLQSITIEGFRSFRLPEEVDLSGLTLAAITGPNHSGKTSLLRAIEYALYGPAHGEAKSMMSRGLNKMSVSLDFSVGDEEYTVTRSHGKDGTGHKLMLTKDDNQVGSRDIATTQQTINDLLGMGRDVARSTWMAMQGDVESLALMDGPTRRGVFVKAFMLDRYEALSKTASAKRRDADREIESLRGELAGLNTAITLNPALDGVAEDRIKAKLDDIVALEQHRAAIVQLEPRVAQIAARTAQLTQAAASLPEARKALSEAHSAAERANQALAPAEDALSDAKAQETRLMGLVKDNQAHLDHARRTDVGHCDACGQTLTDEAHQHLVDFYEAALSQFQTDLQAAQTTRATASTEVERLRQARAVTSTEERNAQQVVAVAENAESQLVALESERMTVVTQLEDSKEYVAKAETRLANDSRQWSADDLRTELTLRAQAQRNTDRAKTLADSLAAAQQRHEVLGMLASAYAASGIPMNILRGVAGEVSDDANTILEDMESPLEVTIDASGSSVDLSVNGSDWGGLSGQERFYVALALRLALGRAVARRTGHGIGTMLLDEGWGALDPEHAQRAVDALTHLTKRVGILTVTHIEDVGTQMPQRIEVDYSSGTSLARRLA